MTGIFDGSTFVAVDMAGHSTDHAVTGAQEGIDGHQVGLSGTREEIHPALGTLALVQDQSFCLFTPFIGAIAAELGIIGMGQGFQDGRMGPVVIVVVETDHDTSSLKKVFSP